MISWLNKLTAKFSGRQPANNSLAIVQNYSGYDQYVAHQKEKTCDASRRAKWLGEEWQSKLNFFESKFREYQKNLLDDSHHKALCLGARTGQEVQAFRNLGFDAIGVDLVACEPLVVEGDIHNLAFDDDTFDVTFTNIFDHSFYPDRFASEIMRVLKPNGLAIMHLAIDTATDPYGVLEIPDPTSLIALFESRADTAMSQSMPPWGGGLNWELVMKKKVDEQSKTRSEMEKLAA